MRSQMSTRKWLTVPEVARVLGYSQVWIRQRIEAGDIPASRLKRGQWRIPEDGLMAAMEANGNTREPAFDATDIEFAASCED